MPVADPNTFTGALLDRAADGRRTDAAWVHEQMSHPGARAVLAADEGMRVRDGHLALVPLSEAPAPVDDGVPLLLGLDDDGPVFAIDEGPATEPGRRPAFVGAGGRRGEPPPADDEHLGLREAAQTLDQAEGGLAAYAAAMLNWHRSHRFCANCGTPTDVAEAGMVRRCPNCRAQHHPRVDPVVIMVVTDGAERVLLGRQRVWPARRYSALAGFVSPGESLEEAVVREVFEEVGVRVGRPEYRSSQPWPFPGSLMLGFNAPVAGGRHRRRGPGARGRALVRPRRGGRRGGRRLVGHARRRRRRAAAAAPVGHRAAADRGLAGRISLSAVWPPPSASSAELGRRRLEPSPAGPIDAGRGGHAGQAARGRPAARAAGAALQPAPDRVRVRQPPAPRRGVPRQGHHPRRAPRSPATPTT